MVTRVSNTHQVASKLSQSMIHDEVTWLCNLQHLKCFHTVRVVLLLLFRLDWLSKLKGVPTYSIAARPYKVYVSFLFLLLFLLLLRCLGPPAVEMLG